VNTNTKLATAFLLIMMVIVMAIGMGCGGSHIKEISPPILPCPEYNQSKTEYVLPPLFSNDSDFAINNQQDCSRDFPVVWVHYCSVGYERYIQYDQQLSEQWVIRLQVEGSNHIVNQVCIDGRYGVLRNDGPVHLIIWNPTEKDDWRTSCQPQFPKWGFIGLYCTKK